MNNYFVFDIETTPLEWEKLSESQQEYWLRGTNTEKEIEDKMSLRSLTPLTAKIACIACMVLEHNGSNWNVLSKGVLATNPDLDTEEIIEDTLTDNTKIQISSEYKVLKDFWKLLVHYQYPTLISFNGRNFDVPFVVLRSAINRIKPAFNLMSGTKFNYPKHIDLIDELTFFNPVQYGATKRFNFDFYAHSFGITSPKSLEMNGSLVAEFFAQGKIKEIAEYCMRDVVATWDLFLFWDEYLNFKK